MSTLTEVVGFQLVNAKTGKEIKLAMQRLFLVGKVLPVGARLVVQHTFSSREDKPLEVVYSFPLPRDAALRRFRVAGKGFSVHSQLKPVEEAVKAYEEGIEQGHLSTLVQNSTPLTVVLLQFGKSGALVKEHGDSEVQALMERAGQMFAAPRTELS